MTEIKTFLNKHFNPKEPTVQVGTETKGSLALGLGGLACLGTAAIGKVFFKANTQTALMIGGAGAGFLASHFTKKDGYAYSVAGILLCIIGHKVIDKINKGAFFVTFHIDPAEIIRAYRENT